MFEEGGGGGDVGGDIGRYIHVNIWNLVSLQIFQEVSA